MRILCEEYYGGCPSCGVLEQIASVGPSQWALCNSHGARWLLGIDLFPGWQQMTDDDIRAALAEVERHSDVTPLALGEEVPGSVEAGQLVASLFSKMGVSI